MKTRPFIEPDKMDGENPPRCARCGAAVAERGVGYHGCDACNNVKHWRAKLVALQPKLHFFRDWDFAMIDGLMQAFLVAQDERGKLWTVSARREMTALYEYDEEGLGEHLLGDPGECLPRVGHYGREDLEMLCRTLGDDLGQKISDDIEAMRRAWVIAYTMKP